MFTNEMVQQLLKERSLSEVLGFETDEVARQGSGSMLNAFSGNSYIDFTGGIAVHACGHNHPEIVAAVRKQSEQVLHTSDIMRHTPQLELAQFLRSKLDRIDDSDKWQFLFLNCGSESIDAAAKLALKATGRTKFIAFDGAFHGRTLFATALSCSKTLHWSAYEQFLSPLRQNILRAPAPPVRGCVDVVQQLLESNPDQVAAIIFEPQQT